MARILVVDDSEVIRELLADFLADIGHEVETAANGEEGLSKAQCGRYDLCICDLHLPKKNGLQILSEMRSRENDMKFIFTDSLPDGLYEQIRKTTGHLCLRKPFDLNQVRTAIDRTIGRVKTV